MRDRPYRRLRAPIPRVAPRRRRRDASTTSFAPPRSLRIPHAKMSSFFGSSPSGPLSPAGESARFSTRCGTRTQDISPSDMQAKKEAVMQSVRGEIALQNAQDLMGVSCCGLTVGTDWLSLDCRKPRRSVSRSVSLSLARRCPAQKRYVSYHIVIHTTWLSPTKTCLSRCLDRYLEACTCPSPPILELR